MTAPNIPAALARLAVDMENLADLTRRCKDEPDIDTCAMFAGVGGEIWERAQDELTHNRVAALVAEVIAWRELADRRAVPSSLPEYSAGYLAAFGAYNKAVNDASAARATTDKAFEE